MSQPKTLIRWKTLLVCLVLLIPIPSVAATSITFWTTETSQDRQAVVRYLADVFMIFNPDIIVKIRGVGENSMAEELARVRNSDSCPDLVGCASNLVVALSNQGWVNCPGAEKCIDSIGSGRFYAGTLRRLQLADGEHCGVPFNGWVQGIWYRKDWFEKRGLAPPDTWENILKAARAFHDPQQGRYGILIGTKGDAYAEQVFTHLALSAGVKEVTRDGTVVFDSPQTVKTVAFYNELARYTPPGHQTWRGRDYYLQGKMAMMFYSTFIMDDLAIPAIAGDSLTGEHFKELKGAPFDYQLSSNTGFVSTITGTEKASFGVLHALGLMKTGDAVREEATERFVKFLFTKDAYISWLHMVPGGMMPVLRDIAMHETFFRDPQGVFQNYSRQRVESILLGFDSLKCFCFSDGQLMPQATQISAEGVIGDMLNATLYEGVSPREAVAWAAERMRLIQPSN
ncbi:ABC transporter substrate-binding protein [Pseudodesulfovibrio sediminis]|uniref:Sugar ABC transporter substrate-binding protein n=1 Tax=Pseudodesulfovibrio sediminis TaxID=2810563 RepID=A0ABM7P533_9BACT|nr:extracellular solute-binding protein [Pseudodesulfovibrio sediminis]BCS87967.1 sugar ABC transporter substrate-binding protein [Pseudodesulfovibrio sediminis]